MAEHIQFVCDQLAGPPYNMSLTMVGLDNKSADELLHLMCEVFACIAPKIFDVRAPGGGAGGAQWEEGARGARGRVNGKA